MHSLSCDRNRTNPSFHPDFAVVLLVSRDLKWLWHGDGVLQRDSRRQACQGLRGGGRGESLRTVQKAAGRTAQGYNEDRQEGRPGDRPGPSQVVCSLQSPGREMAAEQER